MAADSPDGKVRRRLDRSAVPAGLHRAVCSTLRLRVGHRGAALLFFAFLDFVYCASLLAPPPDQRNNPTLLFFAHTAPLALWGALWGIAGLFCLVNAFRNHDKTGFTAAIAIKTLWAAMFVLATIEGVPRAYVSATLWLTLAGWVAIISTWPEPPPGYRILGRKSER